MAKEDFCFTYYDGDAARDMAHMNRLERGAYGDLIVSQRKFGHLSLSLIKKTLGNDFDTVWEAVEIILIKDSDGKFFIEWLDTSIIKMKKQSKHQSNNGKLGGRPKAKQKPNETQIQTQKVDKKNPLGDGDGYEDEIENELKGGNGEKLLVPEMQSIFKKHIHSYGPDAKRDFEPLLSIAEYITGQICNGRPLDNQQTVIREWEAICLHLSDPGNFYNSKSLKTISTHIQEIFQRKKNGVNNPKKSGLGGKSGGFGILSEALKGNS